MMRIAMAGMAGSSGSVATIRAREFLAAASCLGHGGYVHVRQAESGTASARRRKLGLSPTECVAVENAPLGVQSAKRAHICCIAICSTVQKRLLTASR